LSSDDAEFERALRKELKRGVKGETDKLLENLWAIELGTGMELRQRPAQLLGYPNRQPVGWNHYRPAYGHRYAGQTACDD